MNTEETEKIFIDQAVKELKISRSTVYKHIRRLHIKLQKFGKKSYLTPDQLSKIKENLESSEPYETGNTEYTVQRIKELKAELEKERQENKNLILLLGEAQGETKILKEQNQKLLEQKNTITINPEKTGIFAKISKWWKK